MGFAVLVILRGFKSLNRLLMSRIVPVLMYLGVLPFVAGIAAILMALPSPSYLPDWATLVASYALVILSFMCGVHWGLALSAKEVLPVDLFLASNIITLGGWITFLLVEPMIVFQVSAIGFVVLLGIDWRLRESGVLSEAYLVHRRWVTLIVVVSLFAPSMV